MKYYVKKDAEGNEIDRKPVTRGRPPLGYEKIDDGLIVESDVNHPVEPATKNPEQNVVTPKVVEPKQKTLYVKYDEQGKVIETKTVTRGRPPKDYVKVIVDDAGNIMSQVVPVAGGKPVTESQVDLSNISQETSVAVPTETKDEFFDETSALGDKPVAEQTITKPKYGDTKTIMSTKHTSLEELKKYINAHNMSTEGKIVKFLACDLLAEVENHVDYLHNGMAVSRIDVDTETNDIYVWRVHTKGDPDIIIKNAIAEIVVV